MMGFWIEIAGGVAPSVSVTPPRVGGDMTRVLGVS
jgi:hypothetical protein